MSISLITETDSKQSTVLVHFDRPVRTVELTKNERLRFASLLADSVKLEEGGGFKDEKNPHTQSTEKLSWRQVEDEKRP